MDWKQAVSFYNDYPELKKSAYSLMAKYINNSPFSNILDYGSGDGKLVEYIKRNKEIYLYDINNIALEKAKSRNKDRQIKVLYKEKNIPKNFFEIIVFSLVLMCLNNKNEIFRIINNFNKYLISGGELLVLITHPAFREQEFSYFKNVFDREFNYFEEGMPYKVIFKNLTVDNIITDYHWSLSFTINAFLKNGFILQDLIEMKDVNKKNGFKNENFSPYILIKFKKQ